MLNYDLSKIDRHLEHCYVRMERQDVLTLHGALTEEWSPDPDVEERPDGRTIYRRLSNVTKALIEASPHMGIGLITQANTEEVLYRLDLLFDSNIPFLYGMTRHDHTPLREVYPIRIAPHEVRIHVGLSTSAPNLTDLEFDALIRQIRKNRQRLLGPGAPLQ